MKILTLNLWDILISVFSQIMMITKNIPDYIFTLYGGAIHWKSFMQYTVADSTCKAKYITTSDAAKEAIYLRKFIYEFRVVFLVEGPVLLYCDSTCAIA